MAKKFSGILARPIEIRTKRRTLIGSLTDDEIELHNKREILRAVTEQLRKINELREWLGLDDRATSPEANWVILALKLAQHFVPGFRIKDLTTERSRGRKKEWNWEKYCQLLADVESLKKERTRTDSEACLGIVGKV
jgi:hypothetical protein